MTVEQKKRFVLAYTQIRSDRCRLTYDPMADHVFMLLDKSAQYKEAITELEAIDYLHRSIEIAKFDIETTLKSIDIQRRRIQRAEDVLAEF